MKKLRHFRYALLLGLPIFLAGCTPFSITIFSPLDGENFEVGEGITFTGSARDVLEGKLTGDSLVWTSDIDGQIGTGNEFIREDLSEGIHEITLTAINSQGGEGKYTIHIGIGKTRLITDSSQLISFLNSLEYTRYGLYADWELPISEDVQIIGTITISTEQLTVNGDPVGFSNMYGADGITFAPYSLTLTNIKLRFRALRVDRHPDRPSYVHVIRLMPPSDHECEGSQIRCETDQVCYDSYHYYCKFCLDFSQAECLCRDEDGILPDGTYCKIFLSNDVLMDGECQDGECFTRWNIL